MAQDDKSLRIIIITAAVTALVTGLITNWLPTLFTKTYEWMRQDPVVIVRVFNDDGNPLDGVKIALSHSVTGAGLDFGTTDKNGELKLRKCRLGTLALEAVLEEGSTIRTHRDFYRVDAFPYIVKLTRSKDFSFIALNSSRSANPAATPYATPSPYANGSPTPSPQASPATTPVTTDGSRDAFRIRYGKEPLTTDRKVKARLEIDWLEGSQMPELKAQTSAGTIRLEDVLNEVGIELEVVRSDKLPASVVGPDGTLNEQEAKNIAALYKNARQPDKWHFYLIVVPKAENDITSFMFDPQTRSGAALVTGTDAPDQRFFFVSIIHEIGHMLNLPHPFQAYGDTKSVMSYFWRWSDWSWDDPQIYRFDQFGQTHIRRAPDDYVMPGRSAFLDYGAPVKWGRLSSEDL